jgi:hypothetical protein
MLGKVCDPKKWDMETLVFGSRPLQSVVDLFLGVGTRSYPNLISNRRMRGTIVSNRQFPEWNLAEIKFDVANAENAIEIKLVST